MTSSTSSWIGNKPRTRTRSHKSSHKNAPLTPEGRKRLIERCRTRPIVHVATEMGISRTTASKWVNRYRRYGDIGLLDRSSAPLPPGLLHVDVDHMTRMLRDVLPWFPVALSARVDEASTIQAELASKRVMVWRLTGVPSWLSSNAIRDADHLCSRRIDSIRVTSDPGVAVG